MHPDLTTLPMQIERQCEKCGKSYMVKRADYARGRRRFCSPECWYAPRVERVCEHCGKAFSVSPSTLRQNPSKYCGRECYAAAKRSPDGPERTCSRCGETKPIEQFSMQGRYRLRFCTSCLREEQRARYADNPEVAEKQRLKAVRYRRENPEHVAAKKKEWQQANPEKARKAVERSRLRHPERARAREAVNLAVKAGLLHRKACWCGAAETEAHHHLGYEFPHELDVVWLCRKHHRELHRKYDPPTTE